MSNYCLTICVLAVFMDIFNNVKNSLKVQNSGFLVLLLGLGFGLGSLLIYQLYNRFRRGKPRKGPNINPSDSGEDNIPEKASGDVDETTLQTSFGKSSFDNTIAPIVRHRKNAEQRRQDFVAPAFRSEDLEPNDELLQSSHQDTVPSCQNGDDLIEKFCTASSEAVLASPKSVEQQSELIQPPFDHKLCDQGDEVGQLSESSLLIDQGPFLLQRDTCPPATLRRIPFQKCYSESSAPPGFRRSSLDDDRLEMTKTASVKSDDVTGSWASRRERFLRSPTSMESQRSASLTTRDVLCSQFTIDLGEVLSGMATPDSDFALVESAGGVGVCGAGTDSHIDKLEGELAEIRREIYEITTKVSVLQSSSKDNIASLTFTEDDIREDLRSDNREGLSDNREGASYNREDLEDLFGADFPHALRALKKHRTSKDRFTEDDTGEDLSDNLEGLIDNREGSIYNRQGLEDLFGADFPHALQALKKHRMPTGGAMGLFGPPSLTKSVSLEREIASVDWSNSIDITASEYRRNSMSSFSVDGGGEFIWDYHQPDLVSAASDDGTAGAGETDASTTAGAQGVQKPRLTNSADKDSRDSEIKNADVVGETQITRQSEDADMDGQVYFELDNPQ